MTDWLFGCKECGYNVTIQADARPRLVLCDACDVLMACRGRHHNLGDSEGSKV